MTVSYKVGTFTKSTNTSTPVDQAVTGVGFQPKAIILYSAQHTADDSAQAHAAFVYGVADGVASERGIWTASEDNATFVDSGRYANDSKVICLRSFSGTIGTLLAEADLKSFDSDGFTLTWTTNDAIATIIKYIAIGGDEITTDVIEFTQNNTTGSQSVTSSLNTADFVMLFGIGSATKNSLLTSSVTCLGMASGPSNEGAWNSTDIDGLTTSQSIRYQRTNMVWLQASQDSPETIQAEAEFTNFTSGGFDLNWITSDGSARVIFGLVIKGGNWEVGSDLTRTSDGTEATTTSFKPQGIMIGSIGAGASSVVLANARMMFGAASAVGTDESITYSAIDSADTTNTWRKSSSTKIVDVINISSGANAEQAELDSYNATDFTLDYTLTDATAREFIWAAVEESVASTNVVLSKMYHGQI